MPELEPITREEMLLDGQDLEPITRKEMFIKRIYDKTQVIPEPITREEMFLKKAGDETTDVTIEQLNVSENGTYSEEGVAYSPVIVNVPAPPIPDNAYLLNEVEGLPKDIASFSDGSNLPMPSLKVGIEPIQEGSGDPSPENIRPISGHTEVNVTRCGKNLATESSGNNKVVGSVRKGCTYTFSVHNTGTIGFNLKKNSNSGDFVASSGSASSDETISVTFTADDNYNLFVNGYGSGGTTYGDNASNYQLEIGDTSTAYEPYNGHTTTIPFTDSQGNPIEVFGGECDVVNGGEQPMTYAKIALADVPKSKYGNYQYGIRTISSFFDSIPNSSLLTGMSNTFVLSDSGESYNVDKCSIVFSGGSSKTSILISTQASGLSADASVTEINEWLRSIDAYIVYPLATPSTFNTEPTMIKSNEGSNNVWGDTGDITDAEYFSKEV